MALFEALAATWPAAETRRLGSWTLRRGGDGGNRVSAATLDGPVEGLEAAEAAMRAWGQRPLVMVRPGDAALDAALAARGYAVRDPSLILSASATAVADPGPPVTAITCDAPLAAMGALWAACDVGPDRMAVMARVAGPKTWLMGRFDDRLAGCAFVATQGDVAMLHALVIAPEARRRGAGAILTRAAAAWAVGHGVGVFALAVTEANTPARALYAGLGMTEAARYHYRLAPQGD